MPHPSPIVPPSRSQGELDAEFALDRIVDLDEVLARRRRVAEAASTRFEAIRVVYGPHPDETLLLFQPARTTGPAPVLIFVHGGFWSSMEARQFRFLAPGFVPFGAALAIIDYPLMPTARMADLVAACRRAVAWVHRQGADHGIDPHRIHVGGNSAGGHLVAELMDRAWHGGAGLAADVIKGGTAISGLYDLTPVAASFRNELLRFEPEEIARYSPLLRQPELGAPLIVAVGAEETDEFLRQSASFADLAAKGGAKVEHMVLAGMNHITIVLDALADPDAPLNRAVRRQMGIMEGVAM
jgi:arylformamidase